MAFSDNMELIMTITMATHVDHPAYEQHHLAAVRHVAAAYHHLQAIDQRNNCHHGVAKTHAKIAQTKSAAAQKHSVTVSAQSKKELSLQRRASP